MKSWLIIGLFLFSNAVSAAASMVKVKNYDVEYEMAGSGDVIVLLEAGGAAGLSDWEPIFKDLAKITTVIRYSRLGNGRSYPLKKNYSSEEYAEEALLFLKSININKPIVYVAHSYVAYIARIFAARYPDKVAALMLVEPASEHDVDIMREINLAIAEQEIAQIKVDDLANGMSNQYLDFWAKRPLPDYPQIPDIPVSVIASIKKYKEPSVLFFSDRAREMWGKLHQDWVNEFPQGKIILTEESYHHPQFDEPQMVIREIKELIGKVKH
ncbi:alpha/beta fold hydrolase [Shewanella pealeana]|uniref:Alpha/beta hydrolase fold n=1 Tax=Shewanella pealeana (strain ATCC 700345 / ANG-SQ1) TaxID=398579 RepID=A8H0G3_SHEPA|nr:alpha/beta hydrolase fold [Shewanella pealeana ATCC 700345]